MIVNMAKECKQFTEVSDEELQEVTGGGKQTYDRTKNHDCTPEAPCPNGYVTDQSGCPVCK